MFSRTITYALRAVLLLAQRETGEPISAEDIAAGLGAPRNYMSKTLYTLVREGILQSVRGPHGGFTLAIDPHRLSVGDIVDVFAETRLTPNACLMANRRCNPAEPCIAHERWTELTQRARIPLMRTMISELCGFERNTTTIAVPAADHAGTHAIEAGRNPISTGTKS